jgi:hypothetical protein
MRKGEPKRTDCELDNVMKAISDGVPAKLKDKTHLKLAKQN